MNGFIVYAVTFLTVGVLAYYVDTAKGLNWYRAFYKWTHKEPLAESITRGFIVGRSARERVATAVTLACISTAIIWLLGDRDIIVLLWKTLVEFAAVLGGFTVGGVAHRIWKPEDKAAKVLNVLDDIEAGSIDPTQKAKDAFNAGREKVSKAVQDAMEEMSGKATPPVSSTDTTGEAEPQMNEVPQKVSPKESFEEKLKKYQEGGR